MPIGSPLKSGRREALLDMFSSMLMSETENVMEAEIGGLVMVIRVYGVEELS